MSLPTRPELFKQDRPCLLCVPPWANHCVQQGRCSDWLVWGVLTLLVEEAGPRGNSMKPARDIPLAQQ